MHQDQSIKLLETNTPPEAIDSFSKALKSVGALYFSVIGSPRNKKSSFKHLYSSCPKEWIGYYRKKNLEKEILSFKSLHALQNQYVSAIPQTRNSSL